MKFIRDNIVKILVVVGIFIVLIIVLIACSGKGTGTGLVGSYSRIEDNFKNAATKFLQKHSDLLPKEEGKIVQVQMDTVYTEKQMKKIVSPDDKTVRCDGYVNVRYRLNKKDQKEYRVVPHIKCGDLYETEDLYIHILENEDIVTQLDGLYKIGDNYIYRGENPNNFIKIGDHLYRILSIDKDGYIKLINAYYSYVGSVWDNRYNIETGSYDGINDYTVSRIRQKLIDMYNNEDKFSETERNVFVKRSYCIGKRSEKNLTISNTEECQVNTDEDYLSLPILYDYYIASVDTNCKSIKDKSCSNYNYLISLDYSYTSTGSKERSNYAFQINKTDTLAETNTSRNISFITFISDVSYASGKGTEEDPYLIK